MERSYPGRAPVGAARRAGRSVLDLVTAGVGFVPLLTERCRGLLVNSEVARRLVELDLAPLAHHPPIHVLPPACPPVRPAGRPDAAGGSRPSDDLVVAFGVVSMAKRPDLLVDAAALAGCRVAFVGPCPPILVQVIGDRARARGVTDRITVTGAVDETAWRDWLARASLAVQLRDSASGETSAAVLEALASGVPVVSNLATAAEYGDGTVSLVPSADADVVAERIGALLHDADARRSLSDAGLAFAAGPPVRPAGRHPAVDPVRPVGGGPDAVKLGLVVPRYGVDVVGGTEHWLRMLCEHLVSMRHWEVEVFTTCATSAATWADELPPGDSELGGVSVHRHLSVSGRDPRYAELNALIRDDPGRVPNDVARRFVELVGPVCPAVLDQAASSDCDLIALSPYLFWPSVVGAPRLGRRVIFHGAAHDEPELHLPIMREVFLAVGGFAFNSYAERALVERMFPIAHLPAGVIGNSVAEGEGDPATARRAIGLEPDEPFVLCLGRVERDKGAHALAALWRHYRRRRPDVPRLVLLGPVHEELVGDDDVIVAGRLPETVKWGALRGCEFLIAPSAWESFSLVVLEAWLAGRPVVVNGHCDATVEHCRRSGGGLWFSDLVEFEVITDRLLADEGLRADLARRGGAYARRQFSWSAVVDRYVALAHRIAASPVASGPGGRRPTPL